VVQLQGAPTRELRGPIAERRTASIRHAHSAAAFAMLEPVVGAWALAGHSAVAGAAGEDAGSRLAWPGVDGGMRLTETASQRRPVTQVATSVARFEK
jgi:hypothetical protein